MSNTIHDSTTPGHRIDTTFLAPHGSSFNVTYTTIQHKQQSDDLSTSETPLDRVYAVVACFAMRALFLKIYCLPAGLNMPPLASQPSLLTI